MLSYPGKIHNDSDGMWIEFPDLPISGTYGETTDELIQMAEECISGYLEYLLEEGKDIPMPSQRTGEDTVNIPVPIEIAVPVLVRNQRKLLGLTQNEVAEKMNVSYRTLQNVERKKRSPSVKTLNRIAKAFGKKLVIDFE